MTPTRQEILVIVFFVMGCMILAALHELIYVTEKSRVMVAFKPSCDNVIEGEFSKPSETDKT